LEGSPLPKAIKARFLSVLALSILLTGIPRVEANNHVLFPSSEKVIYFLDVSNSSDSVNLWRLLRNSLLERLDDAMGAPNRKGLTPKKPTDLSISVINSNSSSSSPIEIISIKDTERLWAFMINKVGGGKPTEARMRDIYKDFFGGTGVYRELLGKYIQDETVIAPSTSECEKSAEENLKQGLFMDNVTPSIRTQATKEVCAIIQKLSSGLKKADATFLSGPKCKGACSDVVGGVKVAAAVARDLSKDKNAKLCIAIASDMLNNSPQITKTGAWHTLNAIKNSPTLLDAEKSGQTVASQSGILFSSKVKIRVEVIGQGGGPDFNPELTSKLDAYWSGFWKAVGLQNRQQSSLDQACSGGNN
jgi:hypothetical protein